MAELTAELFTSCYATVQPDFQNEEKQRKHRNGSGYVAWSLLKAQ
jgi:hypothetical protein